MKERCPLTLSNRRTDVEATLRQVETFCRQHLVPLSAMQSVLLALEELLVNIVTHGYHDEQSHTIAVMLELHDSHLSIEITDDGMAFDPRTVPAPNFSMSIDERPIGGLGVWLILQMMDEIDYRREGHMNKLRLVKVWT